MSGEQAAEIQRRLDDLSIEEFERDYRTADEAATEFFQDLFVEVLNFEEMPSNLGDALWQDLPVHEWRSSARATDARMFAEAGNFRVVYIELEKLTRTAERNSIQSLTRSDQTSGWAMDGSFLALFHAPDEKVWHLVTPYEEGTDDITNGRPVLRRYTLGEGETHHTVSNALAELDSDKPGRLAGRVDEAFQVKPVTEDFYENYKSVFKTLTDEFDDKGLDIEEADRYAHIILNRLMFFYYLQKKEWIGDRKDFIRWYHEQYQESDDEDVFHEKWLNTLFFEGMNQPEVDSVDVELSDEVESVITGMPYMNGGLFQPTDEDQLDVYLSDAALNSVIHGFLEEYNFTVTEESPYDIDVAVDPAMLGKIYESLIAEQERGEAGIFYTPRVEVDLMSRMALYEQFIDHANDLDSEGKQRIVEFIFSEPQDWDVEDSGKTEQLENILHELRIVDPACGSGAFLVGMKQVLTELYRKLGTTPDYHLKEQIINENLYGVDIKDWAVRVAEFRLWLSLVEGEEQLPDQCPVLPNFSFKLKVGDSLIQKLDGEYISLDTVTRTLNGNTGDLLSELKELKREHFEGEGDRTQEIEEKQVELLKKHIDGLIDNLSKGGSQQTLSGDTKDDQLDEDVQERIEDLEKTRNAIDEVGAAGFFMWDIDFSDVMVEGGFDIVIGNPPYVRQEDIIDQGIHPERLDEMDSDEVRSLKQQYKNDLVELVEETFDIKPYKRSDIYVYFYFKGIDLLRENGTLSFITSNSWLDIGYGKRLHEGLLKLTDLSYILGNTSEKSFEDADVNTYITIANRKQQNVLADYTHFVQFSRPFFDYNYSEEYTTFLLDPVSDAEKIAMDGESIRVSTTAGIRTVSVGHDSLWRLGGGSTEDIENANHEKVFSEEVGLVNDQAALRSYAGRDTAIATGSYEDGIWGRFIDAPTLYFAIWRDSGSKFSTLGNLVSNEQGLKRGTTSGANKFFFVPRPGTRNNTFESSVEESSGTLRLHHNDSGEDYNIEKEYWMRDADEVPERFIDDFDYIYEGPEGRLVPNLILVKNREIKQSPIKPSHLNSVHLQIEGGKTKLDNKQVTEYIKLGEKPIWGRTNKPLPDRPTLSATPWYEQPNCDSPFLLLNRTFNANFQFHYNPCLFEVADNFFYLPEPEFVSPEYLAGYMNSTLGWFMTEVTARAWTNTLRMDKFEYQQLPILNASGGIEAGIEQKLEGVMSRDIGNVFEELNAYSPEDFEIDKMKQDRRSLDEPFLDKIGLTTADKKMEFYQEMIRMVRDRLMRQPEENPSLCETIAQYNPQYDYSR